MQDFFEKNKKMVIIATVIIVLLVGGLIAMTSGKSDSSKNQAMEEPTEAPIPTVDASVKVELVPTANKQDATVKVSNAPAGTESIDIELSYPTEESVEGAFGEDVPVKNGSAEKEFKFGTCSSGVCRYHKITGDVKVNILFTGSYGEKIFEKSFKI